MNTNNIDKQKDNHTLKLLAIILMIIDHIGALFFPDITVFRGIGRLSFPLFLYQLCIGFSYTKNINRYLLRIWIFALISQIPYTLAFDTFRLNIFFSLFMSLFLFKKIEEKEYSWILSSFILTLLIDIDYGFYGILLALMFYFFKDYDGAMLILTLILNIVFVEFFNMSYIQHYSVFAILLIALKDYLPMVNIDRRISYAIYPLHLLLFSVLKYM